MLYQVRLSANPLKDLQYGDNIALRIGGCIMGSVMPTTFELLRSLVGGWKSYVQLWNCVSYPLMLPY
jgi:hypothetical protein